MVRSRSVVRSVEDPPLLAEGGRSRRCQGEVNDAMAFAVGPRGLVIILDLKLVYCDDVLKEPRIPTLGAMRVPSWAMRVEIPSDNAIL